MEKGKRQEGTDGRVVRVVVVVLLLRSLLTVLTALSPGVYLYTVQIVARNVLGSVGITGLYLPHLSRLSLRFGAFDDPCL
mgnify:CR=1 FL=1